MSRVAAIGCALGVAAVILPSCVRHDTGGEVIVVSQPALAWAARSLTGDTGTPEVVTLLPAGADPETYEPTLSTMRDLARASMFMYLDTPGFERSTAEAIRHNFPGLRMADLSEGIPPVYDHSHEHCGHDHAGDGHNHASEEPNPHMLLSTANMRVIIRNMQHALTLSDPASASVYSHRADSIVELTYRLDSDPRVSYAKSGTGAFAIMHPALSYMARDWGLTQVPLEQEGREATPRQYMERLRRARGVSLLIADAGDDPTRAAEAARQLGIPVVTVPLGEEDWPAVMDSLASAIYRTSRISTQ